MKIQECVFDKIEDAYNEFKEEMQKEDPEEIFEKAYKISIIAEIKKLTAFIITIIFIPKNP